MADLVRDDGAWRLVSPTGVVIGVSGQIGTAVARRMLRRGWSVRGLHSAPTPLPDDLAAVQVAFGDRDDDKVLAGLLADGVDGVVDTIAYASKHAHQLLGFAGAIGALGVVSSIAVYADEHGHSIGQGSPRWPEPIRESQSLVSATDSTYGGGKVLVENTLLEANRFPVTSLRPAAVCGPGSRHLREWWVIKRVLDDRRVVPLKYRGLSKFHPSSTANIAALAVHCLQLPGSRVLNAADPDCPTAHEIVNLIADAMSHAWQVIPLPDDHSSGPVGETPWTDQTPIVLDTSASLAVGYQPAVSYAAAMPSLVEAALTETAGRDWRQVYPDFASYAAGMFHYATEDDVIARLRTRGLV
jgi:nucleoside-diphosphate-sugar epimerase